jgi:hypothetical protein
MTKMRGDMYTRTGNLLITSDIACELISHIINLYGANGTNAANKDNESRGVQGSWGVYKQWCLCLARMSSVHHVST